MSLSIQRLIVTLQHCSLLSSGKIILTLSNLASLICDRGGMNKGSKEPFPTLFPPPLSGYIYSGSLWFGTMPHANYKRRVSFDLWDLGCWIWAITETKSFGFQGEAKNRRVHLLKPKRKKKLLLIKKLESLDASLCKPITFLSHTSATIVRYNK